MKSIIARNRKVMIVEQEDPLIKPSYVVLETLHTAISPGTELSLIEASEGRDIELGYSAVGIVLEVGENVSEFKKGDRVACYGAPYVGHRSKLLVPTTLCAKVPDSVESKEASLAGIGAIAIHALRTAKLTFGEVVVIVGLGVLGQMIAKIAAAAAYEVFAFDIQSERSQMLHGENGIRSFSTYAEMERELAECTKNHGADAVLLCAGGKRSELTSQSLNWVRNQGKVVIVGDIEPEFPRHLLFAKEAQILISRAGGPGRYDPIYEKQSIDYPFGYVRWTEGRNIAEYLRLLAKKQISVQSFLVDEVHVEGSPSAFDQLIDKKSPVLTKVINFERGRL